MKRKNAFKHGHNVQLHVICACARLPTGICSSLTNFIVSNDFGSGQRRSWSSAQSELCLGCPRMPEGTFYAWRGWIVIFPEIGTIIPWNNTRSLEAEKNRPSILVLLVLHKSIAGRYRPISYPDGPISARCRFICNASWDFILRNSCPAKTCLRAYADTGGSDQPAHPLNRIRAFTVRWQNHLIEQNVWTEFRAWMVLCACTG